MSKWLMTSVTATAGAFFVEFTRQLAPAVEAAIPDFTENEWRVILTAVSGACAVFATVSVTAWRLWIRTVITERELTVARSAMLEEVNRLLNEARQDFKDEIREVRLDIRNLSGR